MTTTVPADTTLRVARLNALFCAVATTLYVFARVPPSRPVETFLVFGPSLLTLLWLQSDVRRTHLGPSHDLGLLMMFAGIVFIPWYAFKSRGRDGWGFLAGLLLLWMPSYVTTVVLLIVFYLFGIDVNGFPLIVP